MLLLSPIVTNLQWNEQYKIFMLYILVILVFLNKNTVNLLDCKFLPNSPTCLQTLHCTH